MPQVTTFSKHLATGAYTVLLPSGGTGSSVVTTIGTLESMLITNLATTFAAQLSGHLLLPDSSPVAGAFVELHSGGRVVASATTGADGAYEFQLVTAGTFTLSAIATTATFADRAPITIAAGTSSTKDLTSGNDTLALTFNDPSGPLVGAQVTLFEVSSGHAVATATLDASEVLNFSHLAAGSYRVLAAQTGVRGALATISVAGNGATPSTVAFVAQGTIAGHVTGIASGAGAQVTAYLASTAGVAFTTQAAADGSYAFAICRPGITTSSA